MMGRKLLLLAWLLVAAAPGSSSAQTRFSLAGGVLVPFGELGNTSDPSFRVALRGEFQPLNSLGQRKLLSLFLYGAYSDLTLKSESEAELTEGEDTSTYLFDVGAGVRVYSRVAPFYLTGGAGYARYQPAGDGGAMSGLDVHGGLGFAVPLGLFLGEVEATLHEVLVESDADFQFLAATLGVALPF